MNDLDPLTRQHSLLGDKYRLEDIVGTGGVGTVYRATHIWTERRVAVKVLDPRLPHFDQLRQKFLVEARAAVQLHHPNVVDVLDMGEDDPETVYLVMELLEGPTLRDVLLDQGSLSPETTLAVLWPLIDALEKAHALGIIHRDFKPENIMLSLNGHDAITPKLLDFGVAEVLQDVRSTHLVAPDNLVVGTPQYMSPEQVRDQRAAIGPHTDVWGVGVVCYECLTGRSPFDRDEVTDTLRAVCEEAIDFGGVPETLVPLLQGALNQSPDRRTPTIGDLKQHASHVKVLQPEKPQDAIAPYSWPMLPTRTSGIYRTLTGLGPGEGSSNAPEQAPANDTASSRAPSQRLKRIAWGGIALTLAIAVATWWTTSSPSKTTPKAPKMTPLAETIAKPTTSATEADSASKSDRSRAPAAYEPFSSEREPKPMNLETARSIIESSNRQVAIDRVEPTPRPPASAEVAAASSADKPVGEARPRQSRKAARRPNKPPSDRHTPALVTEW